jgi:hypothetical protein
MTTSLQDPIIEHSRIARGLFMGSRPPRGPWLRRSGFHVLVLCACDFQPPTRHYPDVDVTRIPLDDTGQPLAFHELEFAKRLAQDLSKRIQHGENVLVTCNHGRNRSGLVAALTFRQLTGCSGAEACAHVKLTRNSPFGPALTNPAFEGHLSIIPSMKRARTS